MSIIRLLQNLRQHEDRWWEETRVVELEERRRHVPRVTTLIIRIKYVA
jgi:hypothetical protein